MQLPKPVIAAVAAAGLVGGAAGAVVLAPTISGAQDAPEATAPQDSPQTDHGPRGKAGHHRGDRLQAAADAIGVETEALAEALRSGQTLAQVAEANGVDPQTVIDAMVAEANTHLDEAVAEGRIDEEKAAEIRSNLTERITTFVNEGPSEDMGRRGGHHRGPDHEALAEVLGIDAEALHEALRSGETLAQVAEANGVDPQTVIDAMVAQATTRIDEAVADGKLDAAEADEKKAELTERITTMVNEGPSEDMKGRRGPGGPGGHHGPRGPLGDEAPQDAPEVEGSSFSGRDQVDA